MALTIHRLTRQETNLERFRAGARLETQRPELERSLDLHPLRAPAHLDGEIVELFAPGVARSAHHVDFVISGGELHEKRVLAIAADDVLGDRVGPDRRRLFAAAAASFSTSSL